MGRQTSTPGMTVFILQNETVFVIHLLTACSNHTSCLLTPDVTDSSCTKSSIGGVVERAWYSRQFAIKVFASALP